MNVRLEYVAARLRAKDAGAAIVARVRRLNADLEEGMQIRGLHRKPLSWRRAKALAKRGKEIKKPFMERGGKRLVDPWMYGLTDPARFRLALGV